MPKTLNLNLIKKWFDLTEVGIKKEEYRDITNYWAVRFIENWNRFPNDAQDILLKTMNNTEFEEYELKECVELDVKRFDFIHFKNGFARNGIEAPCFDIELESINIAQGKPEWGAVPGKRYFVLKHGELK